MAQMVVEDVMDSWQYILIGLLISMIVSLIFIAMMRWVAAPLVWLSILGIIGMLSYGMSEYKTGQLIGIAFNKNKIYFRCVLQLHSVRLPEDVSRL